MPIYEYRCDRCNDEFEVTQKISDPPLAECPRCQGPVHKLISQSSFVLKGSGWYLTDYARKKEKSGPKKSDAPSCSQAGSKSSCSSCAASGD
ncbi:MAG: zinc ribbon domain-containing protein [Deltaproteobacteria bacterium]|nr:zinc ribbon domain-containing protein [Deltaproteobacteria bacterium]